MAESYSSVRFIKDFKICQEHTLLEVHKDLMNMSERKDEEIGRHHILWKICAKLGNEPFKEMDPL